MRILIVKKDVPILSTIKNGTTNHIPDDTTQQLLTTPLSTRSSSLQSLYDQISKTTPKKIEICRSRHQSNVFREVKDCIFVGIVKGLAKKLAETTEEKVIKRMREDYEKNGVYPVSEHEVPESVYEHRIGNVLSGNVWNDIFRDETVDFPDYEKMNEVFCRKVQKIYKPGDVVWVVDHSLWLLPQMLRKKAPNMKIAVSFFDDFPAGSKFENFAYPAKLLESLLNATYLGFGTKQSKKNFLKVTERIFQEDVEIFKTRCKNGGDKNVNDKNGECKERNDKNEGNKDGNEKNELLDDKKDKITKIQFSGREILCQTQKFSFCCEFVKHLANTKESKAYGTEIKRRHKNKKIVVSVSNCASNTLLKIYKAIDSYFEESGKNAVFYCIEIPGGNCVAEERAEVCRMEEFLKMKYGHEVVVRKTGIEDFKYYGLCQVADCALLFEESVLHIADFLSLKKLVIGNSNFKIHKKLVPCVNPYDAKETAKSLRSVLEGENRKFKEKSAKAEKKVCRGEFFEKMQKNFQDLHEKGTIFKKPRTDENEIIEKLKGCQKSALVLDYDGTLCELVADPATAKPTEKILQILKDLAVAHKVVVCTGRDKNTIDSWISIPEVDIYAEHGFLKRVNNEWSLNAKMKCGWKQPTLDIMRFYEERTPHCEIEEKLTSVVFHFNKASEFVKKKQAHDLKNSLRLLLKDFKNLKIGDGKGIVEVNQSVINKGSVIAQISKEYETVLCCGDDVTDEDMFRAGNEKENVISVLVGDRKSQAQFAIESVGAFLEFLSKVAKTNEKPEEKTEVTKLE